MLLGMHEQERLMFYTAGKLALERKERGLKLNLPEPTALLTSYFPRRRVQRRDGDRSDGIRTQRPWTCHGSVPVRCSYSAALASKATGLFQPKAECLRRGL